MCGIVGYAGNQQVVGVLMETLSRLEYRGYDSAGVSIFTPSGVATIKSQGRLQKLADKIAACGRDFSDSFCGIGHTRWATHGSPSDVNAHPHCTNRLSLAHNGIIENYCALREELEKKGYSFVSQTDTEVAAKLIDSFYSGDPAQAIRKACGRIEGSYAFAIIFADQIGKVYAVRRGSPLIAALGNGENFVSSDVSAVLKYTRRYVLLEEEQIAVISARGAVIYGLDGTPCAPIEREADWTAEQAQKDGYAHFMLKEINEQPAALYNTVHPRIRAGASDFSCDGIPDSFWRQFASIYIVACGSAMHAGRIGKRLIEELARVPVECDVASEFRYRDPILENDTLVVAISQSGETADTLASLRLAKSAGVKTLAVVNVSTSSAAREADYVINTYAGPEISVASTKAYSVQTAVMYLIAFKLALLREKITLSRCAELTGGLLSAIESTKIALSLEDELRAYAPRYRDAESLYFLGRGLDYVHAMEGALKMKEISYIHCESYAGGELKHGTISLITSDTGVVAIATQTALLGKMVSNIKEVCARGADVLLFCKAGDAVDPEIYSKRVVLPALDDLFMPIVSIIPLQLLAYYTAIERGCDVDKPRNLAKSVTVE